MSGGRPAARGSSSKRGVARGPCSARGFKWTPEGRSQIRPTTSCSCTGGVVDDGEAAGSKA